MITTYFDITHSRKIDAACKNCYPKGKRHPSRIMELHDFIYILKGEWEITQENETYLAREGDIVILTAGAGHGGQKPCADGTETIFIHTDATENETIRTVSETEHHLPLKALIHSNGDERIIMDFQEIAKNYAINRPYQQQRLSVLFNKLLLDLRDADERNEGGSYNITEQIEQHFLEHPNRFFSNRELAKFVWMGEKNFVNKFKSANGTTPHQYQLLFKLRQIRSTLIACPEMKIRELAQTYGFCDEFHLSKAYKKVYGISPREYRKQFSKQ